MPGEKPFPSVKWMGYAGFNAALENIAEVAEKRGLILREGTGRRTDPFRYWLPASEARWRKECPLYDRFEELRRGQKLPWVSLEERKRIDRDEDRLGRSGPAGADDGDDGDGDREPA